LIINIESLNQPGLKSSLASHFKGLKLLK